MSRIGLPRWLYPGMHLKRWLLVVFAGIVILGLGGVTKVYRRDATNPRHPDLPRARMLPTCAPRPG